MAKTIERMETIFYGGGEHFIITVGKKVYFQSYRTLIAIVNDGDVTLNRYYWDCSKTTAAYRNKFLGLTTKETEKRIASKEIRLRELDSSILQKLNPDYFWSISKR